MVISPYPCGAFPPGLFPETPPDIPPPIGGGEIGPDVDEYHPHTGSNSGEGNIGGDPIIIKTGGSGGGGPPTGANCQMTLTYESEPYTFIYGVFNSTIEVFAGSSIAFYELDPNTPLPTPPNANLTFDSARGRIEGTFNQDPFGNQASYDWGSFTISAFPSPDDMECSGASPTAVDVQIISQPTIVGNQVVLYDGPITALYDQPATTCPGNGTTVNGRTGQLDPENMTAPVNNLIQPAPSAGYYFFEVSTPLLVTGTQACIGTNTPVNFISRLQFETRDPGVVDAQNPNGTWFRMDEFGTGSDTIFNLGGNPANADTLLQFGPYVDGFEVIIADSFPRYLGVRHQLLYNGFEFFPGGTSVGEHPPLTCQNIKIIWSSTPSLSPQPLTNDNRILNNIELLAEDDDVTFVRAGSKRVTSKTHTASKLSIFQETRNSFIDEIFNHIELEQGVVPLYYEGLTDELIEANLTDLGKRLYDIKIGGVPVPKHKINAMIRRAILSGEDEEFLRRDEVEKVTLNVPPKTRNITVRPSFPVKSGVGVSPSRVRTSRQKTQVSVPTNTTRVRTINQILVDTMLVAKPIYAAAYPDTKSVQEQIKLWYIHPDDAANTTTPYVLEIKDNVRLITELGFDPWYRFTVEVTTNDDFELEYDEDRDLPNYILLEIDEATDLVSVPNSSDFVKTTRIKYKKLTNANSLKFEPYPWYVINLHYNDPIIRYIQQNNNSDLDIRFTTNDVCLQAVSDLNLVRRIPRYLVITPTDRLSKIPLKGASTLTSFSKREVRLHPPMEESQLENRGTNIDTPIFKRGYVYPAAGVDGVDTQAVGFEFDADASLIQDETKFVNPTRTFKKSAIRTFIETVQAIDTNFNTEGFLTFPDVIARMTNTDYNKFGEDSTSNLSRQVFEGTKTNVPLRRSSRTAQTGIVSLKESGNPNAIPVLGNEVEFPAQQI